MANGRQHVPTKQDIGVSAPSKPPWTMDELAEHTTSTYSAARFAPRTERDLEALANRWYRSTLLPAAYYAPRKIKDAHGVECDAKYNDEQKRWHYQRGVSMAIIVMRYGATLGVLPEIAIRSIDVIEGQPAPRAQLAAGIVLASKLCLDFTVLESTAQVCKIRAHRRGMPEPVIVEATYKEYAHLHRKTNWMHYPADMVYARCVGRVCRRLWPDLFAGVYLAEERLDMRDDASIADSVLSMVATESPTADVASTPAMDGAKTAEADEMKWLDESQAEYVDKPKLWKAAAGMTSWPKDRQELVKAEIDRRVEAAEQDAKQMAAIDAGREPGSDG